jgi:hypothetical protein
MLREGIGFPEDAGPPLEGPGSRPGGHVRNAERRGHMSRTVTVTSVQGLQRTIVLYDEPDACPRCHRNLVSKLLAPPVLAGDGSEKADLEEARQCTSRQCGGIFVAVYQWNDQDRKYHPLKTMPLSPVTPDVPDEVAQMSPTFVEIFTQALAAEGHGLTQISGVGLRKALEFLVKDFAIRDKPSDKEKILAMYLGPCIQAYIADAMIKQVAARAVWLGNDETQYLRRWNDQDVSDLKVLIRITVNGLDNVLLAAKYIADMPAPDRKE